MTSDILPTVQSIWATGRPVEVSARTNRPDYLFRFFTDDLCLPVALPLVTYPSYTTGSIALGNCFLEITSSARRRSRIRRP